ncbi:MAG: low-specificity L-threonine aldolase [Deltaproteobacteria bacterium]|nr:low-specificity L-threonine aldolase [Deltaproteobacteria bacterium]
MREAMFEAEVGDDVYGEDPTVSSLEARAAEMLGKQAGLFVASGTQSNLVALLTHCGRGDEYIAGATAHTYQLEGGGGAALGGIQPQTLPFEPDGSLDLDAVEALVKPANVHYAKTRLICLENTQDGRPTGPDYFGRAHEVALRHDLKLHLDGARYWNAVIATGCEPTAIAEHCDSLSICLSKGLGAPVGSLLVGSAEFIERARRWRKMVGGGMRQAGVIAAAGLYALTHHIERLAEDHEKAAAIAATVNARFPGAAAAHTNMVFVQLPDAEIQHLIAHFSQHRIRIRGSRWVTHLDVGFDQLGRIERALETHRR